MHRKHPLSSPRRRRGPLMFAGVVIGAVVMVAAGAYAASFRNGTFTMAAGTNLEVRCPTVLSNSNVAPSGETVSCADTTPSTTAAAPPTTVAPPTTTTPPTTTPPSTTVPPAGQSCATPTFTTSSTTGTETTDPTDGHEYWWVNNDEWSGTAGPQTLNVCSPSSWYAVSNQTDHSGAVETYPDTEYDIGGRATLNKTPITGFTSITSTFDEAYPTDGSMDAAYDLWTNNYSRETMIWNEWSGDNDYWGNKAMSSGIPVTLGGVPYHVLVQNANLVIFFRDSQVKSGSADILAAWQWEVANGDAAATDIPTQIEYGVEIIATVGTETFPLNGLTVSVS